MKSLYTRIMLSFTLGLMCISAGFAQSVDPVEELKVCAKMADPDDRSSCYDSLGQRLLGEDSADATSKAAPETSTPIAVAPVAEAPVAEAPVAAEKAQAPAPLPDDLGGGQFSDEQESDNKEYRGLVNTCKKGLDGFWYFRFENGQVWKHVNVIRRQYRDCNFYASIVEERMGYKMQIEGDDSRVRVTRIR